MSKIDAGAFLRLAQDATKYQPGHKSNMKLNNASKLKKVEDSYKTTDSPWSTSPDVSILKLGVVILIYTMFEDDGVIDKRELKALRKAIKMLKLSREETTELMTFTERRVRSHDLDNYITKYEFKPGSVIYAANIIIGLDLKQTSKKLINSVINDYNEKRNI